MYTFDHLLSEVDLISAYSNLSWLAVATALHIVAAASMLLRPSRHFSGLQMRKSLLISLQLALIMPLAGL